jgi:hypothetical protein
MARCRLRVEGFVWPPHGKLGSFAAANDPFHSASRGTFIVELD